MFNYDSVCLTLKTGENSVYKFNSDELHKIDLSLCYLIYFTSCDILSNKSFVGNDVYFSHCVNKLDTLCRIYDVLFASSRGDDYDQIVFDKLKEARSFIKDVKNRGKK